MSELTDEAKKEIADAVRIVREDRILKYMRENRTSTPPTTEPTVDPTTEPPVDPTKPVPPPVKPPEPPKPKKRGVYWGDVDDE